jgi:hypothetical protein
MSAAPLFCSFPGESIPARLSAATSTSIRAVAGLTALPMAALGGQMSTSALTPYRRRGFGTSAMTGSVIGSRMLPASDRQAISDDPGSLDSRGSYI